MIRAMRWDETIRRWRVTTNQADELRARYVVMAIGPWSKPKLPGIPGLAREPDNARSAAQ